MRQSRKYLETKMIFSNGNCNFKQAYKFSFTFNTFNHEQPDLNPLTLFRMGGAKRAPYQFLAFKTFWLFVLTLLPHWCKISGFYLEPVPNYLTWTKTTRQKKRFFWSNPYKIEVMITSLIEMLELPNFGHMTASTI